jgi:hypothetical protein
LANTYATSETILPWIRSTAAAVALLALRTRARASRFGRRPTAEPASFHNANAAVGFNHRSIRAGRPGPDTDEHSKIVIEAIHLGDFAGLQPKTVGDRDLRRRVECRTSRLNRNNKPWLLPEPGDHRYFVSVHGSYGDASRF